MSSGVSISLCPVGEFFDTLICSLFCFIVFGLIPITPLLLTLPLLLVIIFGFTSVPLIVITLRIYHISPSGILFVVIVIASPTTFHVPMSSGASITLCPIGVSFVTLICISFCFIVFGLMVIIPVLCLGFLVYNFLVLFC